MRLAGLAMVLAAVIAAVAFAVPRFAYHDAASATSDARMLRTDARHASSIPPLRLQLTAFDPDGPSATYRWRTIFGVPYGTTTMSGESTSSEWNIAAGMAAWLGFIAAEAALLGGAAVALRRAP